MSLGRRVQNCGGGCGCHASWRWQKRAGCPLPRQTPRLWDFLRPRVHAAPEVLPSLVGRHTSAQRVLPSLSGRLPSSTGREAGGRDAAAPTNSHGGIGRCCGLHRTGNCASGPDPAADGAGPKNCRPCSSPDPRNLRLCPEAGCLGLSGPDQYPCNGPKSLGHCWDAWSNRAGRAAHAP